MKATIGEVRNALRDKRWHWSEETARTETHERRHWTGADRSALSPASRAAFDTRAILLIVGGRHTHIRRGVRRIRGTWLKLHPTLHERGEWWLPDDRTVLFDYPAQECFFNSAEVWRNASPSGAVDLCVGYALGSDGCWFHHGFCADGGTIVETTPHRWVSGRGESGADPYLAYFGVRLSYEEAGARAHWLLDAAGSAW
jgi:hypothetical protein